MDNLGAAYARQGPNNQLSFPNTVSVTLRTLARVCLFLGINTFNRIRVAVIPC
jgi:hypothetical protein